ncbi:hypothetical protein BKA70DRAFT_1223012 [Coprinopsis sp. MPI-PUGE-AT-0042]|nr:hypothetical protein BKA70DRAFT_1223012 [Coprinopsis sp. MPI-PUGE-AT-0042]
MSAPTTFLSQSLIVKMLPEERPVLDTILSPSNQSLRALVQRMVDYQIIFSRAQQVLQTDIPRLEALNEAVEKSPNKDHIAIVKPGQITFPPSNMARTQQEKWYVLQEYHTLLEKEPAVYEDYFGRAVICFSASVTLQDFIHNGVLDDERLWIGDYIGSKLIEESKKEVPDAYAKAWTEKQLMNEETSGQPLPSQGGYHENRLMYHDILDEIVAAPIPPSSPTSITLANARQIVHDERQLARMKFSVHQLGLEDEEPLFWTCTLQSSKYWLKFSLFEDSSINAREDEESQVRVTEDELVQLLLHSTAFVLDVAFG